MSRCQQQRPLWTAKWCIFFDTFLSTHQTQADINPPGSLAKHLSRSTNWRSLQLQNTFQHSNADVCAFSYQFIKIQILGRKRSKHKRDSEHENTSDLFCLPCLLVHGTLHANRMQMHLIESGDVEVIVFGEMSNIFFSFHHYQWGVFFMKSILNKSYHHSRALWSSFVTCGCGCIFNFLSIKSKYTPLFFSPTVKSKQAESTWADRWGIFIYICQPSLYFFVDADDGIQQAICACMPSITHSWVRKGKKFLFGAGWKT